MTLSGYNKKRFSYIWEFFFMPPPPPPNGKNDPKRWTILSFCTTRFIAGNFPVIKRVVQNDNVFHLLWSFFPFGGGGGIKKILIFCPVEQNQDYDLCGGGGGGSPRFFKTFQVWNFFRVRNHNFPICNSDFVQLCARRDYEFLVISYVSRHMKHSFRVV